MIVALLFLAGGAAIAYGYVDDDILAMMAGFLGCFGAVAVHEVPIFRRIAQATPPPVPEDGELLDFSDIDWSDFDHCRAIYDRERAA